MIWIHVHERLPENDDDILVSSSEGELGIGYYDKKKSHFNVLTLGPIPFQLISPVKYWMPLPKPPEENDLN